MDLGVIGLLILSIAALAVCDNPAQRSRRAPCPVSCLSVKKRLVCASDGLTYPSKCEVRRAKKCGGKKRLKVVSKGACPEKSSSSSKCLLERESAKQSNSRVPGAFIPQCNPDGTYREIQYHAATGYYFCVNPELGRPIAQTSSRHEIKDCSKGRRGSGGSNGKPSKGTKEAKECSSGDRNEFNKNLIALFSKEFDRIPRPSPSKMDTHGIFPDGLPIRAAEGKAIPTSPEKKVIEWKFTELDNDKDDTLKSRELRSLKKMVRKIVKPKACAKKFVTNCDLNNDGGIKRDEWSTCLGVDFNSDAAGQRPRFKPMPLDAQIRGDDSFQASSSGPTLRDRQTLGLSSRRRKDPADERGPDNEDKINDCNEERRAAEETNKADPASRIYIPRCQDNGKYLKEQCHDSTGYCWCADEGTGRPIPGTATHKVKPVCDGKPRGGGHRPPKPKNALKGCPGYQKKTFLQQLLDLLTAEMMASLNSGGKKPEDNPEHSLEERVVRWKLMVLDKNNNKVIDKKERKTFKLQLRRNKSLKKCGRNFVTFCDKDRNKKITADELVDCMGLNEKEDLIGDEPAASLPVRSRKGPNPFSKYLKS